MSIEIKRSDKYVDYNISATNNRGYITIDTSDWINKPWMFYELPSLKFEIYTETNGELLKYQNFTREIRTYNPVYSPLGVLNVTIDIRNVPEEFILRITPIFDNDAVAARNMLVENGIEYGEIWGSDQDVPTQLFNLNLEFIECEGEYVPPTPPVPPTHEETITGVPPITFDGSTGEPLVSWTILGNSYQASSLTPDNPVMPEFVGVRTWNLCNNQPVVETATTFKSLTQSTPITQVLMSISADTEYTCTWAFDSVSTSGVRNVLRLYDTNTYLGFEIQNGVPFSVPAATLQSFVNSQYPQVIAYFGNAGGTMSDFMLNLGSTALPYEPFGYKIPISCAGQTTPVYLGEAPTVRRVKKLVLTGEESFVKNDEQSTHYLYYANRATILPNSINRTPVLCNELPVTSAAPQSGIGVNTDNTFGVVYFNFGADIMNAQPSGNTVDGLKEYLASEYSAGHPVTIWYVLATEQTGIVNEPLAKIGDYADELSSEDAGITIPTVRGQNVLTVETELQPSEMTITYIKDEQ